MRTELGLVLGLATLLACGGSRTPPAPPPAPASKCAHVADHLLSLLTATARDATAEELDRVRAMFNTRCRDDGWSLSAQECFLALRVKEDVDRCAAQLTDTQRRALEQPAPASDAAGSAQ